MYLAAVLEYLIAEMVELGGNAAWDNKKYNISPRHLQLAIRNDAEYVFCFPRYTLVLRKLTECIEGFSSYLQTSSIHVVVSSLLLLSWVSQSLAIPPLSLIIV